MQYTTLCGVKVSKLGYGTPRSLHNGADPKHLGQMLKQAFDSGINYFDTAPAYGSEHTLRALPRHEIIISTKSPRMLSVRAGWATVPNRCCTTLERSLEALNTDYIDFYWLHSISLKVFNKITPEIWKTLEAFKQTGKVRYIGISELYPSDYFHVMAPVATKHPLIDCFMIAYNRHTQLLTNIKPMVGMLIDGPTASKHLRQFTVTLTGTSNMEHLKQNVETAS